MPLPIFTFNNSYNNIIIHTICTNQIRLKCIVHYEFDIYRPSYITSCRCMYMVVSAMIRCSIYAVLEIEHFRISTIFCASERRRVHAVSICCIIYWYTNIQAIMWFKYDGSGDSQINKERRYPKYNKFVCMMEQIE